MNFNLKGFLVLAGLFTASLHAGVEKWDWTKIQHDWETLQEGFNKYNFRFGQAESNLQVDGTRSVDYEGNPCHVETSWTNWHSKDGTQQSHGCYRWDAYPHDHELMRQSGVQTVRLSVEWSKIEPTQGKFNKEAMQHFVDVCYDLHSRGMTPMICLQHHSLPKWFYDKGGFEHERNIQYFVNFAEYVFNYLHQYVKEWMPINEPVGYIMKAYKIGDYPGDREKRHSLKIAGKVVLNTLKAHVAIYDKFKELGQYYGENHQIGYNKIIHHTDPYNDGFLDRTVSSMVDHLFNYVALDYLSTGKFKWSFKLWNLVTHTDKNAIGKMDFLGINYYSHVYLHISPFGKKKVDTSSCPCDEEQYADGKSHLIYPEGLYRAITNCAKYNVPMIITENGASFEEIEDTTTREEQRSLFFRRHLYTILKALKEGYDVRGYHMWTFMDSLGWSDEYSKRYGLYGVDFNKKPEDYSCTEDYVRATRTLREGAAQFVALMITHRAAQQSAPTTTG